MRVKLHPNLTYHSWTKETFGGSHGESEIEGTPADLIQWAAGVMAQAIRGQADGDE